MFEFFFSERTYVWNCGDDEILSFTTPGFWSFIMAHRYRSITLIIIDVIGEQDLHPMHVTMNILQTQTEALLWLQLESDAFNLLASCVPRWSCMYVALHLPLGPFDWMECIRGCSTWSTARGTVLELSEFSWRTTERSDWICLCGSSKPQVYKGNTVYYTVVVLLPIRITTIYRLSTR